MWLGVASQQVKRSVNNTDSTVCTIGMHMLPTILDYAMQSQAKAAMRQIRRIKTPLHSGISGGGCGATSHEKLRRVNIYR